VSTSTAEQRRAWQELCDRLARDPCEPAAQWSLNDQAELAITSLLADVSALIAERDQLRTANAELAISATELRVELDRWKNCFICVECGRCASDEDGCCATCGRDVLGFIDGKLVHNKSVVDAFDSGVDGTS
jgi:hypothetical protein